MMACLVIGAIGWLGCGVDEEPLRPRGGGGGLAAQSGPDLAALSLEERKAVTSYQDEKARPHFSWPAGESGERDVMADIRSCREKLLADDEYLASHDLVRFTMIGHCMEGLGWAFDPTDKRPGR